MTAKNAATAATAPCPCGGPALATCCAPYLDGRQVAATAELLMRSRYCAYALRDEAYLQLTWHLRTRPVPPVLEAGLKWLGLEVRAHNVAADGEHAQVEFIARYKDGGRAHRLHEISNFVRETAADGPRWYYVDGTFPERRAT